MKEEGKQVTSDKMLRNWRLNIDLSLRLCKFWFELLELSEEELQWSFYTVTQKALTDLGARFLIVGH